MIYTANSLNQYLQRTVPGSFDLLGSAATGTTVTVAVNGGDPESVNRHNTYWHKLLRVDNTGVAAYPEVEIVAVNNPVLTNQPDIVAAETGRVFVAKTPEQFSYDADGNLLQDGRFNYTWDCENRLIAVETRTGAVPGNVPRIKVEMKYDYLGRRVSKQVWEMRGQWSLLSSQGFVYDAWNLIREETTASGTGKIVDEYVWGLDLSGTLQGAGGVGGLLYRQRRVERYYDGQGKLIICHHPPRNPEQSKTIRINENIWPLHEAHGDTLGACEGPDVTNSVFFYTYDGNGNVSELLNQQSAIENRQFIVAHYEYSPFGETIVSTGTEAGDNPFRFSTKYFVDELGIGDWGRRWYRPDLGLWLSRDPMGWDLNLYAFVRNNPVLVLDLLGLAPTSRGTTIGQEYVEEKSRSQYFSRVVFGTCPDWNCTCYYNLTVVQKVWVWEGIELLRAVWGYDVDGNRVIIRWEGTGTYTNPIWQGPTERSSTIEKDISYDAKDAADCESTCTAIYPRPPRPPRPSP